MSSDVEGEEPYRVGPGRPPREHQFKPGVSGNRLGRPPKPKRLLLPLQQLMDVIRVMEAPVAVKRDGKVVMVPGSVAVVEMIKLKALSGHGPSLRQAIKMVSEAMDEIEKREFILAGEVDKYLSYLSDGHPPGLVTGSVNSRADKLNQLYREPSKNIPKKRKSRRKPRFELNEKGEFVPIKNSPKT